VLVFPLERFVMRILHLTLKKQWFDMILSGEKKAEYREVKDYWARRLLVTKPYGEIEWAVWEEMLCDLRQPFKRHTDVSELLTFFDLRFRDYDAIKFRNGYAKNAPSFLVECRGVAVKNGRQKWGAKQGEFYFALRLGNILHGEQI